MTADPSPFSVQRLRRIGVQSAKAIAAILAVTTATPTPMADAADATTSSLFSAQQVEEGRELFTAACAACHGTNLEGAMAPSLTIPAFKAAYSNKPVRALYSRIRTTMPVGQPGSLTEAQTLKLTAVIYASNGLPVGSTAVTSANELNAQKFPAASKW